MKTYMKKAFLMLICLMAGWANGVGAKVTDDESAIRLDSMQVSGNMLAGMTQQATVNRSNIGSDDYEGYWYLFEQASPTEPKVLLSGTSVKAAAGRTATVRLKFELTEGAHTLLLAADGKGEQLLASAQVAMAPCRQLDMTASFELEMMTQEEDEKKALLIGADEFLTKPFRVSDLKLRIDNIIENRKRIQHEYSQQSLEDTMMKISQATTPSADDLFLDRALNLVHAHLEDDSYDRDALAADIGASSSTLYNKLRSITGMNVSTFIRDIRMKEAKRMAESDPNIRVSDLAYKVGFRDPRYFSTCFKKQFGILPKEFLENIIAKP